MTLRIFRISFLAFILLSVSACFSQADEPPALDGYVTRVGSPSDFDVNGMHVVWNDKTTFGFKSGRVTSTFAASEAKPYFGEAVQVYGKLRRKEHNIVASQILFPRQNAHDIAGAGIVDAVLMAPASASSATDHMVRADGYSVLITPKTSTTIAPPLSAATAFRTNVWITFHGDLRADGVVAADKVEIADNQISRGEDKLRTKGEYDPEAVDPNAKQSAVSKAFGGIDPKQIPPYKDDAMQARINTIGDKLIPKYQRDLPDTDPTKIHFRFQLIDQKKWHDAVSLPSGIILVPHQLVERLQNDSQLATLLADNIACVYEKQGLQAQATAHKVRAAQAASVVGNIFVPGAIAATQIGAGATMSAAMRHAVEQSGRVSLYLLHDAGYDIYEAPVTWWRLSAKESADVANATMPDRATYLYKLMGEVWHHQ